MAKLISVILLCSLTTVRDGARVTLEPAGKGAAHKAVGITAEEKVSLDAMTVKTGRDHYRLPVNEGGDDLVSGTDGQEPSEADLLIDQSVNKIKEAVKNADPDTLRAALALEKAKGDDARATAVTAIEEALAPPAEGAAADTNAGL